MVFYLPIQQSRWLRCLRNLQLACAALAVCYADWPIGVQVTVIVLIALAACHHRALPLGLEFDAHGLLVLFTDGRSRARLSGQCYCNEFIVALRIIPENNQLDMVAPFSLVLLPDSSNAESLRKLRVYLRWHSRGA